MNVSYPISRVESPNTAVRVIHNLILECEHAGVTLLDIAVLKRVVEQQETKK